MSKSSRYFEIIQMLRGSSKPVLARDIAEALEVSVRTIYRDIAQLQAIRTPIHGEPGVGYIIKRSYDLPPLNLDVDEAEAVSIGLSMVARSGDSGLWKAAGRAMRKLNSVAPGTRQLITSSWGVKEPENVDVSLVRLAIREEIKLSIEYQDQEKAETIRVIWPLALIYYVDSVLLVSWCELRQAVRHFRLDRMIACTRQPEKFEGCARSILDQWELTQKALTVDTRSI